MITVEYGGEKLPIRVTNVNRNLMPAMSNNTQNYGMDGVQIVDYYHQGSKIEISFNFDRYTLDQIHNVRDETNRILRKNNGGKLVISDKPNEYYNAYLDGDQTLDIDWEYLLDNKGKITFLIPDGVGHARYNNEFHFQKNSYGVWETTIFNNGTEPVPIDYEINLEKESGFIGLISKEGVLQFGKISSEDPESNVEKAVRVTNNIHGNFSNWQVGTTFYENQMKKAVTTMSSDTKYDGRLGILPSSFTKTEPGAAYYGAIQEFLLPQEQYATDWYLWSKAWFETGRMGQTGQLTIAVIDTNNHLIAGMCLEKYDSVGNTALCRFLLGDGAGGSRIAKTIEYIPSYWVNQNPYGSESRDQNRNMFDIKKVDDKVTFYWYGSYFTYTESRIQAVQASRVQFFVGQMNGYATDTQLVTHHYINDLSFTNLKSKNWRNVVNRFPDNSTIFIDGSGIRGEPGRMYLNNQISANDEILGSQYFYAPPGSLKVQLAVSDFATIKNAKAIIKGAWV